MFTAQVTVTLDNALPHDYGTEAFHQLVTPADVDHLAYDVLDTFERMYSPERLIVTIHDEQEVFAQISFDESGAHTVEFS